MQDNDDVNVQTPDESGNCTAAEMLKKAGDARVEKNTVSCADPNDKIKWGIVVVVYAGSAKEDVAYTLYRPM
jgi:hypothetical protein